jgi:putative endonuclease
MKRYYVYIMLSKAGVLYVGVTNDIKRRVNEHKKGRGSDFTKRYEVNKLVYFETKRNGTSAIKREKQIKAWRREKKVKLIDSINPGWEDLSRDWND